MSARAWLQRIGASPAPKAVRIRVLIALNGISTCGKSPTGVWQSAKRGSKGDIGVQPGIVGIQHRVAGLDGDAAAACHRVARVDGEVEQRVLQLRRVDQGVPQPAGHDRLDLDRIAQAAAQHVLHAGDQPSGMEQCQGTVKLGAWIDTATSGTKTFTVNARNRAGTTATQTIQYRVR